ncbi:hypothetical protein Syncc8109_1451 [Synechococcus sp. WH 8109]|nr:hypothetical protein Syncc8109_1451 [Synechococcus sp. WH 8109]
MRQWFWLLPPFTPSTSGRRPRKKLPPPRIEQGIERIKNAAS